MGSLGSEVLQYANLLLTLAWQQRGEDFPRGKAFDRGRRYRPLALSPDFNWLSLLDWTLSPNLSTATLSMEMQQLPAPLAGRERCPRLWPLLSTVWNQGMSARSSPSGLPLERSRHRPL